MSDWEDRVENDPKYKELKRIRRRFDWCLTAIMSIVYFTFMLAMGYAPDWIGQRISEDAVTSIGLPIGAAVILFGFLLTGIYTWWANRRFDPLIKAIKQGLRS